MTKPATANLFERFDWRQTSPKQTHKDPKNKKRKKKANKQKTIPSNIKRN
jgi:hypothetical protein